MGKKVNEKNIKEVIPVSLRQYYENENIKLPEFYKYFKTVEIKEFVKTSEFKNNTDYIKNNVSILDPDFQKTLKLAEKSLTERKKEISTICIDLTSSLVRNYLEKEYNWVPDMENPEKIFSSVLEITITDKKESATESKIKANIIKIILLWLFFHRDFNLIDTFLLLEKQIQSISKSKTTNATLKKASLKYAIPKMTSILNIKKLVVFLSAWMRNIDLLEKEKGRMLSNEIHAEDEIEEKNLGIEKLSEKLKASEEENNKKNKEINRLEEEIKSAGIICRHAKEKILSKQRGFFNNLKPLIDDAETALKMDKPSINTAIERLDVIVKRINKELDKMNSGNYEN